MIHSKQYRIHLFALCYLVTMIPYAGITSMMYSLYSQKGLAMVAIIDGIFAFLGFGPSNIIVLQILRRVNLRGSLVLAFIGFLIFNANIMSTVILSDKGIPIFSSLPFIYLINILTSFLSGVCNSVAWYLSFNSGQLCQHIYRNIAHNLKQMSLLIVKEMRKAKKKVLSLPRSGYFGQFKCGMLLLEGSLIFLCSATSTIMST